MRDGSVEFRATVLGSSVNRSYYSSTTGGFVRDTDDHILGVLTTHHSFDLGSLQKNAWRFQIQLFRNILTMAPNLKGHIFFEFGIPRMGKRVDVVLIYRGIIFVLEFKVGEKQYPKHAIDQVVDYGLDLKNFHSGSHERPVVPVLVSTHAESAPSRLVGSVDGLYQPLRANAQNLWDVIDEVANQIAEPDFDAEEWAQSIYKPTPTIVEAAQALYQGHDVDDISRSDSGAINLSRTANAIAKVIERSKGSGRKAICFVTGVPGSGKTLAGLNIANERHDIDEGEHAVFLSGNGPLVNVLREALARDDVEQKGAEGIRLPIGEARSKVETFIQNIHHFRDDAIETDQAPIEKVVVFDEAQRAWTLKQTSRFMKDKKGIPNFNMSEPEFLIGVMDRHDDYAVIVCLVGGGQEINTGEAGLPEWFDALSHRFKDWDVYVSDQLQAYEYNRGHDLYESINADRLNIEQDMHLSVSIRSFRAEAVSDLVKHILDGDSKTAGELYDKVKDHYPIVITRELGRAKEWLRDKARGTERYGLVASSGAMRLKPLGLHLRAKIDPVHWFLNEKDDVRSSFYLEDVATEFDIQGLELDWVCVAWDSNLYRRDDDWVFRRFSGTSWKSIKNDDLRLYLKNAYRVLLTRARQGMVILVPTGSPNDPTRAPNCYDETFRYLRSIGLPEI